MANEETEVREDQTQVESAENQEVASVQAEDQDPVSASDEDPQDASGQEESKEADPAKKKKRRTTIIVVAAVVVVALIGLFVWHEQPSFCGAICHASMDGYVPTYDSQTGKATKDKWGNTVSDASGMLAATHREQADTGCMGCHQPVLSQQIGEGVSFLTGNYTAPLTERSVDDLAKAFNKSGEEFCLNESCHNMTVKELVNLYAGESFNPHVGLGTLSGEQHEGVSNSTCSDCHKSHRASVYTCADSGCHNGVARGNRGPATLPEGWITPTEESRLEILYTSSS